LKRKFVRVLLFCLSGMCLAFTAVAQDEAAWVSAHKAYEEGDYKRAAFLYEEVSQIHPTDPSAYYNLANSYYKNDQVGLAVLNYEKARRFEPRSKDIRKNLRLAQSRVKIRLTSTTPEFIQWGFNISSFLRKGELILLCLTLWSAWMILTILRFTKRSQWIFGIRRWVILLGILSLALLGFKVVDEQRHEAVILTPQVEVRYGPSEKEKAAFKLTEGVVTGVADEVKGWIRLELPGNETGWVQKKDLGLI